ncbi:MAG: argininosuccinate lyase [Dysgonamonadaceae bacterium]|jgi:argininosuccinate lyase|nr:argininosuccinate lyase [Dysgonamonadaceae bacterium]
MKLWGNEIDLDREIEMFTVGNDREADLYLAKADVLGSIAHVKMLGSIGLLTDVEIRLLTVELRAIYRTVIDGRFVIEEGVEDVHTQVELMLTRSLGDIGKKVHSGRSRNDQVLLDLKLYTRESLRLLTCDVSKLIDTFLLLSERYRSVLMPGYTHLQVAMPSSFGLWFGSFAEGLTDDLRLLLSAYGICDRNPLGSAAGYGSSFPLDRGMTTALLGFGTMNYNSSYAQMSRGKMEFSAAFALSGVAFTLSKFAYDACLFCSQNFGFITLPSEFTTGSSIMPHKRNPDVFELIRARCNRISGLPGQLGTVLGNLPSGYFRDFQVTKEFFLPSFGLLRDCLRMSDRILTRIEVRDNILDDEKYAPIFSVERINELVAGGVPFRDAYRRVCGEISSGTVVGARPVRHTHEGSIGNLCNDRILALRDGLLSQFGFERALEAEGRLIES